jgi:tetratricopeptide (TPR) repeat protein
LDDNLYVTENAHVQTGLTRQSAAWAFTATHAANWHPVTWLSHMLDVRLFGLDAGSHHFTSLLLHTLNAVLLFLLLFHMTGALWRSAFVAALFALHPMHVESVAWIAERKDVLSTLFWLLTLFAWLTYVKSKKAAPYGLALGLYALGLMAKPMLVTLPFTLLLLDYWPLRRLTFPPQGLALPPRGPAQALRSLLAEKIPFFALSLASCVVTFAAQRGGGAVQTLENLSLAGRLANAAWACAAYLLKTLWPSNLSIFYPWPADGHPAWQVVLAVLLLVGLSAGALRLAGRTPHLLFGWLWYLGTLVPVIGLVQVGAQTMADRYTYMPSVGLFVAAAWGIGEWAGRSPMTRVWASGAATAALLALSATAYVQVRYWSDSKTLFEHALAVTAGNYLAHNNLGSLHLEEGNRGDAISHFREAIRARPFYAQAHDNLGVALVQAGKLEEAFEHYREALQIKPDDAGLNARMATVLVLLNRGAEAGGYLEHALKAGTDTFDAHCGLGMALQVVGRLSEAEAHCTRALEMKPDSVLALTCMGEVQGRMGRLPEAIDTFMRALKVNPRSQDALLNLGVALDHQGRTREALEYLGTAVKIDPDSPAALKIMGMALARVNRFSEAIAYLQEAAEKDPRDVETQYALGRALALERRFPEARDHFQQAVRLRPDDPELRASLLQVEEILRRRPDGSGPTGDSSP